MKTLLSIMPFIFMMGVLNAQSVIHVPADQPSIQAGVDAASNTDTVLVADGTYRGDGNNTISLGGKAITVKSANGPANCIMDAEGEGYFGFADSDLDGIKARVEGFTIRNCKGPGFYYYGGAGPDIVGNLIDSCSGGIILAGGDQSLVEHNIIRNNTSTGIEISNFTGTLASNIIRNNTAGSSSGGGLEIYRSRAIVMNNLISDNAAKNFGGGIYAREDTSLYINNTITSNSARTGSGMYAYESKPILVNNLIAHSDLYLFPEDDKFAISSGTAHDITTTYQYSGGVVVGATISTGFINNGATCDITVHVAGLDNDTLVTAGSYDQFNLLISCSTGGSSQVSTSVSSATDTLIITAYNSEINLHPTGFLVLFRETAELPGAGLVACESEDTGVRNNLFFGNAGGGFLKGNSEDGYVEEDLVGVDGNLITDPLIHESTKVLLDDSPCIDKGTSEIEGVQLPDTDVYGKERIMDGDDNDILAVDIGACEYEYVYIPVGVIPENETEDGTTLQVFPNPFTQQAHVQFTLAASTHVTLELYDYLGRKVASLLNDRMNSGKHSLDFDSGTLSDGIYFFRLQSNEFVIKRKVLLHR